LLIQRGFNINILVTGATGFIGSNLVKKLISSNHEVIACIRKNSNTSQDQLPTSVTKVAWDHNTDLSEQIAELKIDVIIHLATLYSTSEEISDTLQMVDSITKTSLNIMSFASKHAIPVVFANSYSTTISNKDKPGSMYALLKSFDHEIAQYFNDRFSLRSIELSFFDTYGPNDNRKKFLTELIRSLISGEEFLASGGKQLIDLTHVDDICAAIEIAIREITSSGFESMKSYSVGSQNPITLQNLAKIVHEATGVQPRVTWGAKPYRKYELFEYKLTYDLIPNWSPKKLLHIGIQEIFKELSRIDND